MMGAIQAFHRGHTDCMKNLTAISAWKSSCSRPYNLKVLPSTAISTSDDVCFKRVNDVHLDYF